MSRLDDPAVCQRCWGDRQIANTDRGEPWSQWANLPVASAAAVITGIVRPIDCPDCGGSGKSPVGMQAESATAIMTGEYLCPHCMDQGFRHACNPDHPSGTLIEWFEKCAMCAKFTTTEQVKAAHAALCGCDKGYFYELKDIPNG